MPIRAARTVPRSGAPAPRAPRPSGPCGPTIFAALVGFAAPFALSAALPRAARAEGMSIRELGPQAEAAIQKGLDHLVEIQARGRTGAFGDRYQVAASSLAGLALLASGDQVGRGLRADAIGGAVRFLLSGDVVHHPQSGLVLFRERDEQGRLHAHGYAVLFLTQVYGHTARDAEIRGALRGAVLTSQLAQTPTGGYGYHLRGEPGWGEDEASVTITQIQALRAARNAGFRVDGQVIDRAIRYVKRSMGPDGSVCYSITRSPNRRTYELTAAAVSTLNSSGVYRSEELARGLGFLRARMRRYKSFDRAADTFYFYGNFYAAQAMFQAGGQDWEAWFASARDALLKSQLPDGSWKSARGYGDAYATASALLILQMPKRYVPIFER